MYAHISNIFDNSVVFLSGFNNMVYVRMYAFCKNLCRYMCMQVIYTVVNMVKWSSCLWCLRYQYQAYNGGVFVVVLSRQWWSCEIVHMLLCQDLPFITCLTEISNKTFSANWDIFRHTFCWQLKRPSCHL